MTRGRACPKICGEASDDIMGVRGRFEGDPNAFASSALVSDMRIPSRRRRGHRQANVGFLQAWRFQAAASKHMGRGPFCIRELESCVEAGKASPTLRPPVEARAGGKRAEALCL